MHNKHQINQPMRFVFFLLLTLISKSMIAQDVTRDRITWISETTEDLRSGDSFNHTSKFYSNGQTIRWVQNNGQLEYEFNIVSSAGIWTDVGKISYQVSQKGETGLFEITQTGGDVTIMIDLRKSTTKWPTV
jgi:hypothetical protein